ncbi:uncharacterized protein LOC129965932 [Argiope bruennichi]|uniref:Nucleolus and neural progenitor protein-like N-terminal domain-containing protein n=1 Tax=Argiope bruennichi TaxID=94029 RepID=A0A8T0E0Y5_ARGBR|nr:uncharacterized protein LOC129965932 [Argiope bruennichi]KAF8764113.1 hypothetical protein HNY73_022227 [Argiope bruennichi]
MWNVLNLKCPTEDLCQYNSLEGAVLQELPRLVSLLTTSAEVLTQDHPIWAEIKVFRNVQEKYKRILHCDKCLQLLQRVGICLRKMVLLNLSKAYLDLAEKFLAGLQSQSSPIQLPSCQQLEFVLLRTQSAAKLICEALHYSRETFCYLIQRLRVGHLILNLMMATSVTARVNILFRGLLVQIFDIYNKLYIWRGKLKKGTVEWPKPLELPKDLEAWLNPEAAELLKPKQIPKTELAFLSQFFEKKENGAKSAEVSDNMNDDECVIVEETSQLQLEDDVGEVIPRPKKHKKELKKGFTKAQTLLLEKIRNAGSLKKLKNIWNNLDVGSQVMLRKVLTPYKIKAIDGIFHIAKSKLQKIKQSDVSDDVKKEQKDAVIQSTGIKLAKHLGLIKTEPETSTDAASSSVLPVNKLKPAKSLKEFRILYETLYEMLLSTQQYEKCDKLQKKFKRRRSDIKQLSQNNEKQLAKELLICTSKEFLIRFKS